MAKKRFFVHNSVLLSILSIPPKLAKIIGVFKVILFSLKLIFEILSGPLADRFFGVEDRDKICEALPDESDRELFKDLLSKFNVMFTVTQQVRYKVDPIKLKQVN